MTNGLKFSWELSGSGWATCRIKDGSSERKGIVSYCTDALADFPDWTYSPWNATGPLQPGRKLASGTYGEYTNGAISNVRIYRFALAPADATSADDLPKVAQLD
ncbi:hypothetical protein ACFWJM_36590 [Streptomyces sp. NPDC127077]|uniref:hypothetical protein n=1 Tax=Streptomyces sp. NPDC127077 TaxID=3347131 RepID=UPI0036506F76